MSNNSTEDVQNHEEKVRIVINLLLIQFIHFVNKYLRYKKENYIVLCKKYYNCLFLFL
mgnify:CR=1 FL=1